MQLELKPHYKNIYPLGGILIKGKSMVHWVKEIQAMGLGIASVTVYPIPDLTPNSIWGCLVATSVEQRRVGQSKIDIRANYYLQVIDNLLFIPEKASIFPQITSEEVHQLFLGKPHLFYPEIGIVELIEAIDWKRHFALPKQASVESRLPAVPIFIPKRIKSFQVKPVPIEDTLKSMEEKTFPKQEKLKDEPLNPLEKAKLYFYRQLFQKTKSGYSVQNQVNNKNEKIEKTELLNTLESIKDFFTTNKDTQWTAEMQQEYKDLESRNQSQIERLLEMLKKNPQEALKYAIPLDNEGTTRGGENPSPFELLKRWSDFSLFGNNTSSYGSGTTNIGDKNFHNLQAQYHKTAEDLIKQQDYRKAAFIYLKLLKNYLLAAQALEKGEFYQEAASIYLKYLNNKEKAAECYEKGNMIDDAIELYKQLGKFEKAGDLYMQIHKESLAYMQYAKVVESYKLMHQYVKASLILRYKMQNQAGGQGMLLEGWRQNQDAFNCMNNYFANIKDTKELRQTIRSIYAHEVNEENQHIFLQVLKYEINKDVILVPTVREIAYEIIAKQLSKNPSIASELIHFNKKDRRIVKDTIRYKSQRK